MRDRGLVLVWALALMLCCVTPGGAQSDVSKLLIGRWDGETNGPSGLFDRTLIIKSVDDRNGELVVGGEYGGPGGMLGGKLYPVRGTVEMTNGEIVLRFLSPERRHAVLTLQRDGKRLIGTMTGATMIGKTTPGDDNLNLRKVE